MGIIEYILVILNQIVYSWDFVVIFCRGGGKF